MDKEGKFRKMLECIDKLTSSWEVALGLSIISLVVAIIALAIQIAALI